MLCHFSLILPLVELWHCYNNLNSNFYEVLVVGEIEVQLQLLFPFPLQFVMQLLKNILHLLLGL